MQLSKHQSRFILSAVSKDPVRWHLKHPVFREMGGKPWLCATDGHRMHLLLMPDDAPRTGAAIIDGSGRVGIMVDLRFNQQAPPYGQVVEGYAKAGYIHRKVDSDYLDVASCTKHKHAVLEFWNEPDSRRPSAVVRLRHRRVGKRLDPNCASVEARYVGDALWGAYDPTMGELKAYVVVGRDPGPDGNLSPVLFTDNHKSPTWRAIVMPRRDEDGREHDLGPGEDVV